MLGDRHAWFFAVLELLKPRAKRLDEFAAQGRFFFIDDLDYDAAAVEEASAAPRVWRAPRGARGGASPSSTTFDAASLETALRAVAEARGVKAATLIHAVRVAVTGKAVSPGLFEVLALLGRDARPTRGFRLRVAARCVTLAFLIGPYFSLANLLTMRVLAPERKIFSTPARPARGARRKNFS